MTQEPITKTQVHIHKAESNQLGTASFVCSLIGLVVTGGLLCPIGFILGLIAMRKEPRGLAITGMILGLIGSIVLLVVLLIFGAAILAFCGCGAIGVMSLAQVPEQQQTSRPAAAAIYAYYETNGQMPDKATGSTIVGSFSQDGHAFRYDIGSTFENFLILHPGQDGRWNTSDDWSVDWDISDLRESDLLPPDSAQGLRDLGLPDQE